MPGRESISNFLKRYRQENKESQFEFAANIGICVEELSKLERKTGNPRLETLQKIAAYTGNTVSELVYVERDGEYTQMYKILLEEYLQSGKYRGLEESKIYFEIQKTFGKTLNKEAYLEYEEKLNELIGQMTAEAFLAGCEAILKCKCIFCGKG